MTNIGSLMVKQGHLTWAKVLAQSIVAHPRVSNLNKGWAHLILGEVALGFDDAQSAHDLFHGAWEVFQQDRADMICNGLLDEEQQDRCTLQSDGNMRWTSIHLLKSRALLGNQSALQKLRQHEKEWSKLDPEASVMAGLFCAELMPVSKRRTLTLKNLRTRAKRHSLGEIMQRISQMMGILLVLGISFDLTSEPPQLRGEVLQQVSEKKPTGTLNRGNTGK